MKPAFAFAVFVFAAAAASTPRGQSGPRGLYDAAPDHIWNRVHAALHVRTAGGATFGDDEVDPLLWANTKFLLTPPSHQRALGVLDEFLETRAERLIADPVKRAVFQHDLWAVFDWAASRLNDEPETARALAARLAAVMRRVALSAAEIERLPDTYAAAAGQHTFPPDFAPRYPGRAFLPPDLFSSRGPWIALTNSFTEPLPIQHAATFSHSEFSAHLSVPGGAVATLDYLKRLWEFSEPWVAEPFRDGQQNAVINPHLPDVPPGTKVALVRRMLLVDSAGRLARTKLTEGVQLRVFRQPDPQAFAEFVVRRRALFAGESGGLYAVKPGDLGFITFSSKGIDAFEHEPAVAARGPILRGCSICHQEAGIRSMLVLPRLLKPRPRLDYRHPRWSVYAQPAVDAKVRRRDWGLLQALW